MLSHWHSLYLRLLRPRGAEGFELGWEDSGPDPSDPKKKRRVWKGTPPDSGTRRQISKPGSRAGGKKTPPAKKGPAAKRPPGSAGMRQAADGARRMARQLREEGDSARADHLERLASEWDSSVQTNDVSTASGGAVEQAETNEVQTPKPKHRVKDDTPHGAGVRMNAYLDARVDRAALRRHGGRGADLFDGVGTHGPERQAVFPIEGKFYVVDFGKEGRQFTQALREVPEAEVRFHRRGR